MNPELTLWDHLTLIVAGLVVVGYIAFRIKEWLDPSAPGCSGCGGGSGASCSTAGDCSPTTDRYPTGKTPQTIIDAKELLKKE